MSHDAATDENKVHVVLAVWGERFIHDFLQYGLLSLLAPGNIKALANVYPTKFVILTESQDGFIFETNLAFQALKSICEVEFIPINDLISDYSYSTTITYAYDRAIRRTRHDMIRTYFVLLCADYIFADGSFEGLTKYMKNGFSAICSGNFQVTEKAIKPILKHYIDPVHQMIQIPPRELLKKSFKCLHPVTLASMLDQDNFHNYRANRFFYQYDRHTLAGRFYLLHVLCIKPETTNYQIGSSFDYSYIPEMCPSGHVAVIDDSDDYLVVEMQPEKHEIQHVHFGALRLTKLVSNLAEWTTDRHRSNAQHTLYYHTNDLLADTKNKIQAKLYHFIDEIAQNLAQYKTQPFRSHPYWIGAINGFKNGKSRTKESNSYYDAASRSLTYTSKWRKWYYRLLGYPPSVNRFHFRFQEFNTNKTEIQRFVSNRDPKKILLLYGADEKEFRDYYHWLKRDLKITCHFHDMTTIKLMLGDLQTQRFECCVFFTRIEDIKHIKHDLEIMKPMLTSEAPLLIFILNRKSNLPIPFYNFPQIFLSKMNHFDNTDYTITRITTIHNNFSLLGSIVIEWINTTFDYSKKQRFLFYLIVGMPGLLITFIRNSLVGHILHKNGYCTNILVVLVPELVEESACIHH